jgi:Chitobiase/beta-hexosaminidase C-terminal domain/Glycosyl hydrolase family 79 C-terminal beta domain
MFHNRLVEAALVSTKVLTAIVLGLVVLVAQGAGPAHAQVIASQFPTTPFISPAAGTYNRGITVTITDATLGTTIYYTTDGSTPTVASKQYTGPISIATARTTETIRAFGVKGGLYGSATSATYTIVPPLPQLSAPSFSLAQGYYIGAQSVSLAGPLGGVIRYTIDGTTPTAASPAYSGTPIHIAQQTTIKAFVTAISGYSASPVVAQTYSIIPTTPFISPAAGTYTTGVTVTIIDTTPGSIIYYTTDGSTPTIASARYTAPISIPAGSAQETIRAFATLDGVSGSATSSKFTISPQVPVPAPVISPATGSYSTNKIITISDSLSGAKIYYTLDGSTPASEATPYTGPFYFPPGQTGARVVKAIALMPGYLPSAISQSTLTLTFPPGVVATAAAGSGAAVTTIPTDFLGFSHEWSAAQAFMGQNSSGVNNIYRQLVSTLSKSMGGNLIVRIGGGSTDQSGPATDETVIPFAELAQAAHVKFILGVNLGSNNVELAEQQAQTYTAGVPSSALSAIEIGNEPDGYSTNGFRSSTYTFNDYLPQYQQWSQGVSSVSKQAVGISGPALGGAGWMADAQAGVTDSSLKAAVVTQHKYVACYYADSPLPTDILLQPASSTTSMLYGVKTYVEASHQVHTPFRIAEMNSICNGGQPGISNTFSSALWAIDTMFEFANVGVDGVNWNTNADGGPYDLFEFSSLLNGKYFLLGVRPLYYGLLFFARSAGNSAQMLPVTTLTNSNIKVWATKDNSGHGHLVIINKELTVGGSVQVTLSGYSSGTVSALRGDGYLATKGITIAGQTYDGSTDGTLQSSPQTQTIYPVEGVWTIPVEPTSAVSVDLQPN